MAKLTYGVEVELQRHMDNLEQRVQKAADVAQILEPEFEKLQAKLAAIEDYVNTGLQTSAQRSGDSINNGIQLADELQRMLAAMVRTALDGDSHLALVQERSIALAEEKEADLKDWTAVLATATASVQALNNQIVCMVTDLMIDPITSIETRLQALVLIS